MLRNVKSNWVTFGPQLTAIFMTSYPFGADRTELEKAFALPSLALPSLQRPSATDPASDPREITETDRAVALFEHPDH